MEEKLLFLGQAARFDACGYAKPKGKGVWRKFAPKELWKITSSCIYPAVKDSGECVPLLKILLSNACEKNCLYCVNRRDSSVPRFYFRPEELASVFIELYRRRLVKGLFLSSSISGSSVATMDKMLSCVEMLRFKFGFKGYIHLKILPGAEASQVERAGELADRVSINLEVPRENYLSRIAPQKKFFSEIMAKICEFEKVRKAKNERFADLTTQFVVGAAGESDREILGAVWKLYSRSLLKRAYFSAYRPVEGSSLKVPFVPREREYRLYQSDYLLRKYGFSLEELPFDERGQLFLDKDPKELWAERNSHLFPVELNRASYEELIRVPGIGPRTAKRIISIRRENKIRDLKQLLNLRVRIDKVRNYVLLDGKYFPRKRDQSSPGVQLYFELEV